MPGLTGRGTVRPSERSDTSGDDVLQTTHHSFRPAYDINPLTPTVVTAIMHPVPDRVKLSFVIFDIRAL